MNFIKKLISFFLTVLFVTTSLPFNYALAAPNKKTKNLFFYVDYNTPIPMAIALEHPNDQNDILVFRNNKKEIDKLKKVFNHVYFEFDKNSLNEFLNKKDSYDNFFSCNWYHGHIMKYFNKNKKYYHFEDGSYEYYKEKAFNWLCNQDYVSKMFLTFPEYRFKAFKHIPTEKISKEKYLEAIKILYEPKIIDNKIIYCLDCPEFINNKITKETINILKSYSNVAVKCHPRNNKIYLFPKNFTVLNNTQPFESFYYGFNGIFIANLSSCLHTAKFMQPDSTVICTFFLDKQKNESECSDYIKMLKNLGVLFPKTLDELRKMISFNINKN